MNLNIFKLEHASGKIAISGESDEIADKHCYYLLI